MAGAGGGSQQVKGAKAMAKDFYDNWDNDDDDDGLDAKKPFPTIVCLCGSTRFWRTFQQASLKETMAGKIVLSIGAASGTDDDHFGNLPREEYDRVKVMLDELHLRKIDLADEVLILNCDGYIGESTSRELAYAQAHGKRVRFWEGCPHCGNAKEGLDLYAHRHEADTIVCRQCGFNWDGLTTPDLLDYLYGKKIQLAD